MKRNDDAGPEHAPPLSLAEIESMLSQIARQGTGPDKLRALALLRKTEPGPGVGQLSDPISVGEQIERLARLDKAAGFDVAMLAVRRAFPGSRRTAEAAQFTTESLPPETEQLIADKIRNVANLYKFCPRLKRSGQPTGYPKSAGPLAQLAFVQNLARHYFADELNLGPAAPKAGTGDSAPLPSDDDAVPRTVPGPRDGSDPTSTDR